MSYGTPYIDEPKLYRKKAVGRATKMANNNKTISTEAPKASKKYSKTRGEHAKDLIIAMLITGIIAFIGGMHFANQQNGRVATAVKNAVTPAVSAQAPAKK